MGIYIPGMEMPKDGSWRSIRIHSDGTIWRPIGFGDYALVKGAKALPVPKHGNLIDRDVLSNALDDCLSLNTSAPSLYGMFILSVKRALLAVPTIIPAEEGET